MEIQDYPNYLIYDDGLVFSEKSNRFLKPVKNNRGGYHVVNLCKNGNHKTFLINRLVGLHYLPKVQGKDYIDHIDGDKSNNHVNNLRWVTNQENLNNYQKLRTNNTLGLKNIIRYRNGFRFKKIIYGKRYTKNHKNLNELLWFKFVFLLTT
jgi:hypothetical protein